MSTSALVAPRFPRVTRYGTVELGGTKTLVSVGVEPDDLATPLMIPTTDPDSVLAQVCQYLVEHDLEAVGIASFGPVELRSNHHLYGHITKTPKPGWSDTDVVGTVRRVVGLPVGFETDVNGSALGEGRWGAGVGFRQFVYMTVGTGIGAGLVVDGMPLHGASHPEFGHVPVVRRHDDEFPGVCPFHGDCLEGMASGPALQARFGVAPPELRGESVPVAVRLSAFYLAQGVRTLVYAVAPERVIIGGGLSELPGLLEAIRGALVEELGGYPGLDHHADDGFVVATGLGRLSGLAGGLILAAGAIT